MSKKNLYQSLIRSTGIHIVLATALAWLIYDNADSKVDQAFELQLDSVHVHEYQPKPKTATAKEAINPSQDEVQSDQSTENVTQSNPSSSEPAGGTGGEISRYLAQILPLISKQKFYPRASLLNEESGVVEVKIQLSASGGLESYEIKKSSGFPNLDAAALKTLQSISAFPPPPISLPAPLSVVVPIKYELNPDH